MRIRTGWVTGFSEAAGPSVFKPNLILVSQSKLYFLAQFTSLQSFAISPQTHIFIGQVVTIFGNALAQVFELNPYFMHVFSPPFILC